MTEPTPTVKLKNGWDEAKPLVAIIMHTLQKLMDEGRGIVVYELAEVCKDPTHKPWGQAGDDLKALKLLRPDGSVHDSIRNIVLSAVSGEGMEMTLGSPLS